MAESWEEFGNPIAYKELEEFDPRGLEALRNVLRSGKGLEAFRTAVANWEAVAAKAEREFESLSFGERKEREEEIERARRRRAAFSMLRRSATDGSVARTVGAGAHR